MNKEKYVKYIRKRVAGGENIDKVIQSISETVSEEELHEILDLLTRQDAEGGIIHKKENPRIRRYLKLLTLLTFLACVFFGLMIMSGRLVIDETVRSFNSSLVEEPSQVRINMDELVVERDDFRFKIEPVAAYNVSAMVASVRWYEDDESIVAPADIVLFWDKMAVQDFDRYMKVTQSKRFTFYQCNLDCPWSDAYIIRHASNTMVIPSNDYILDILRTVRVGEIIRLEGYLVNMDLELADGKMASRKTSLTRSDTGAPGTELMYVERIVLRGESYT